MKSFFITSIILFASLNIGYAQEQSSFSNYVALDSLIVSFSLGYGFTSVGGIENYYNDLISDYKDEGLNISTQHNFSNTLALEAQILFSLVYPPIWLGISGGYTFTPAFSKYEDASGEVDINGSVDSFRIALASKFDLCSFNKFQVFVDIKPAFSYYVAKVKDKVHFYNYSQFDLAREATLKLWIPSVEFFIGLTYPIKAFYVSFEGGYMNSFVGDQVLNVSVNGDSSQPVSELNCNQSGLIFLVSMGYGI